MSDDMLDPCGGCGLPFHRAQSCVQALQEELERALTLLRGFSPGEPLVYYKDIFGEGLRCFYCNERATAGGPTQHLDWCQWQRARRYLARDTAGREG